MIKSRIALLREMGANFQETGTVFPSSPFLAAALTEPLVQAKQKSGRKIIEVGGGTGPISKAIIERMSDDDQLIICEINGKLCEIMEANLNKSKIYQQRKDQVKIVHAPIQEVAKSDYFDFIICSLPFLNFPLELTKDIFAHLHDISRPESIMTFFSYAGAKKLGATFSKRRQETKEFLDTQKYFTLDEKKIVWLNVMPAYIRVLQRNSLLEK